jgi:hypothetical protein
MPTSKPCWRIIPPPHMKQSIEAVAKKEGRSIAQVCLRMIAESQDRRALDAAITRAGLADAIRALEQLAIARNSTQIMVTTATPPVAPDIEPRRYRKTAEPADAAS